MKENGANDFSQKPKVDMETEKAKSAAAGAVAGAAGMAAALWASGVIGNEEEEKAEQKADKDNHPYSRIRISKIIRRIIISITTPLLWRMREM